MKLEKAIEILRDSIADNTLLITLEHDKAVKLGVEAMKHHKKLRDAHPYSNYKILPGETED